MEKELACEIVKDMLSLYVDGMVSDVSRKSIENHLGHCTDCNEVYRNMAYQLEMAPVCLQIPLYMLFQPAKRIKAALLWR